MRRKPSEAWYILAALILFCGMAGAAFGFGSNVRALVGAFGTTTDADSPIFVVFRKEMVAGESQIIYQSVGKVDHPGFAGIDHCEIAAPSGDPPPLVEAAGGPDRAHLFGATLAPRQRITPTADGSYKFTCPNDTWVFGPDVASWGTQYVVREWTRDFALWFVPGVIVSAAFAGFIAWRRRSTD